ncbi:MAG: iron-sulfur cluster carrier protein ApbC [Acidobacteria bacterium]|nr:iron-sulfur cluster carrier protein ApbC [Acidobacteriota bacterium]
MATEQQVLDALRSVQDPDLHRDIVSLGFIQDMKIIGGDVSFAINLTTPACPVKDQLKAQAEEAVKKISGVKSVQVDMRAEVRSMAMPTGQFTIPGVKNIVPVGSGKGGVGKSTVAANLAVALAGTGARVGLMDADIYGPSIPTILGITEQPKPGQRGLIPPVAYGVKVISAGFFIKPDQAVIWRGPMLSKLVDEFLRNVEWGELDYLIIDLPPGTGDVQLTLCQRIPLTGAVIVSTPQDVALNVAEKAHIMFQQLKCATLGIIENMSYYICKHCGEREEIFSSGGAERAAAKWKVPVLGKIPLAKNIREASDNGRPIGLVEPGSPEAAVFAEIARNLAAQISIRNMQEQEEPLVKITF